MGGLEIDLVKRPPGGKCLLIYSVHSHRFDAQSTGITTIPNIHLTMVDPENILFTDLLSYIY